MEKEWVVNCAKCWKEIIEESKRTETQSFFSKVSLGSIFVIEWWGQSSIITPHITSPVRRGRT